MFLDEARTSAHLSHSNCVQVFDIGVGDNTYFIVMEYVDGADLKAIIEHRRQKGQRVPIEAACLVCLRLCEGLAYAHEAKDAGGVRLGIVHRDRSPPNVLITRHGEVNIVAFGLAKANSQLEKSEPGIIKGKFSYLSPEAAMGEPVDARTDVFAVGNMLWEMLAGRRLFLGETDLETVRQVQTAAVPAARQFNRDVTPELERVAMKALARDPKSRYPSALEFGQDLNAIMFQFGRPVSSFDIAILVQDTVAAREAEKRRKRKDDKVSIIGTLIDEAMLEFTSLDRGSAIGGPSAQNGGGRDLGSAPLNIGSFEGVQDWTRDLALDDADPDRPSVADQYMAGNLAALEDDAPGRPLTPVRATPPGNRNAPMPAPVPTTPPARAPAGSQGGSGGIVAVILVLVVAAGVAGAYFGGLIP
jgi:serine/threonine-protein kinase